MYGFITQPIEIQNMANILSLIENSRKTKKESVASTVRMPESLHTFIETLANDLELSKQEIMLKLLEQGAEAAQEALAEVEKAELAQLAVAEEVEPQITATSPLVQAPITGFLARLGRCARQLLVGSRPNQHSVRNN